MGNARETVGRETVEATLAHRTSLKEVLSTSGENSVRSLTGHWECEEERSEWECSSFLR